MTNLTITKSFKIGLPVITFIIMVIMAIASSLVANLPFDFVPSTLDVILVARLNFIAISSLDLLVLICFLPSAKPFHDEGYINELFEGFAITYWGTSFSLIVIALEADFCCCYHDNCEIDPYFVSY